MFRKRMLNHRQIEIFRTLMLTQNVTLTAEMLYTSQPTISRELKRIEKNLGYSLFQRKNAKIYATEEAYLLYEEILQSYIGLEKIIDVAKKLKNQQSGKLKICCQPFLSHNFIASIFKLSQNQTTSAIELSVLESPFIEAELSLQHFHLGFLESFDIPNGTEAKIIFKSNEVCILPKFHPLLKKQSLNIEDFHHQDFIKLGSSDPYRSMIENLMSQQQIQVVSNIETYNSHSICSLVKNGLGISIINPITALEHLSDEMQIRPINMNIPFYLSIVSPSLRPISNSKQKFLNHIFHYLKHLQLLLAEQHIDSGVEIVN